MIKRQIVEENGFFDLLEITKQYQETNNLNEITGGDEMRTGN